MKRILDLPAIEGGRPVREKFLIFGRPNITTHEVRSVVETMKSGWLGTGPKTQRFEEEVAALVGAKYAVAVNSCTAGLHLSLLAAGVKQGDEVITTPMTFAATANVIEHVGAKPVFVDINRRTMNIDVAKIARKISSKSKAIIPVHIAGQPCEMEQIHQLARTHGLVVIEDAAHAFGAKYQGKPVGSLSDLTVFSFYVTKNLTTGEGGMVTTNSRQFSETIRLLSLHGLNKGAWKRYTEVGFKNYYVEAAGYKYNMTDMQSAIGLEQLKRFQASQDKRINIWNSYLNAFADQPLYLPISGRDGDTHAHHLFTILLDLSKLSIDRDAIETAICAENIGIGTHFIALHLHPYYAKKYHYKRGDFPEAEWISDRTISLPLSADMTNQEVRDVIRAVKKVIRYYSQYQLKKQVRAVPNLERIFTKSMPD